MAYPLHTVGARRKGVNKKGVHMPLLYVFEGLLLVAMVAGGCFISWEQPEPQDKADAGQPAIR